MLAITTRHIIRISKRSLPTKLARMSTAVRAFTNDEDDHNNSRTFINEQAQSIDPLNLDIVSSPEVRKILAQQRNNTDFPYPVLPRLQSPWFRHSFTTIPKQDDGYDSDFEPMHSNWESETDDEWSIDEKRML